MKKSDAPVFLWFFFIGLAVVAQLPAQVVEIDGRLFREDIKILDGGQTAPAPSLLPAVDTLPGFPVIKADFMVNSTGGDYGAEQSGPNIAADSSGNCAVAWIDTRNGRKEIYAQFFNSSGQWVGSNILVCESGNDWNSRPAIAANKRGDFVVAWAQEHNQLLAQRFTKDGIKIGGNFQLNSRFGLNTMEPSVAINDSGYFLAAWAQDISGNGGWNTYARLFDPGGVPAGEEIVANDVFGEGASSIGWGNRVAADGRGNFAVVWSEYHNNVSKIFLQQIDGTGQKVGANVIISDMNDHRDHYFPSVTATDDGHFLVVWDGKAVIGRIYHGDGYFVTEQVDIYSSISSSWYPCTASSDRENTFLVNWFGGTPLTCQQISASGQLLGPAATLVSGSGDPVYGSNSHISNIVENHFYTTFTQYRLSDPDNLLQKYGLDYTPVGDLIKVNDDTGSAWQNNPLAYFNKQGGAIVLWIDRRNGGYDLYAQVYDDALNPAGENLCINDVPPERWYANDKAARALSDGTFVVAFSGSQEYNYDNIYLQKVSPQGQKIGANKLVKENYGTYNVSLHTNENDQIMLCWYSGGYSTDNAYLQKYDGNLSPVSSEKHFIQPEQNLRRQPFALSINDDFNILGTWAYYNTAANEYENTIYGVFFNENGYIIFPVIQVETYGGGEIVYSLANYSIDTKNYIVAWRDSRGMNIKRTYSKGGVSSFKDLYQYYGPGYAGPQILAFENQKAFVAWTSGRNVYGYFFNDNKGQASARQLHYFDPLNRYNIDYYNFNSADIFEDKLLFAYESNKQGGTGYDIWANVQRLDGIDFEPELYLPPVNDDVLHQNFPNPFNSKTSIAYEIHSFHKVNLAIFDILGREVKVLADQYQEKGVYVLDFDASDLPSGFYYCRLKAFKTSVIKMLLIK